MIRKTFALKPADTNRVWYEIDAASVPIGRLAVVAAKYLIGKQKTNYTPHVDNGDHVVIINAKEVAFTGNKDTELVHKYSGYPGGLKSTPKHKLLASNPSKLIELAVYGMLPKNKLRPARMERLRVFASSEHNHSAQKPKKVEI